MTVATPISRCKCAVTSGAAMLFLAACGGIDVPNPITAINEAVGLKKVPTSIQVFGVVSSDDPASSSVGSSIILRGGNAADAAAAMAFAMTVTFPSRAGLGGGGVCLVGGGRGGKVQVLDFLPPTSKSKDKRTDRPSALPTMARGIAVLHARYGRLPWGTVVAPARDFARDGIVVTKAFADELAKYATPLFADPASRSVFADRRGRPIEAGNRFRQIELNTVLSTVGGRGAGYLYRGSLAQRLVEASKSAGGALDPVALRDYLPRWRDPVSVQVGDNVLHAPPPPASAGIVAIQMLQLALAGRGKDSNTPAGRAHLIAEAAKRSLGDRTKWLGSEFGASAEVQPLLSKSHVTQLMQSFSPRRASSPEKFVDKNRVVSETDANISFAVIDSDGLSVACSLTMYHPFGTGRTMPDLGVLLAAAPGAKGRNALPLGPVVVTRASDNATRFAFTGSGGSKSATAMANVMIEILLARKELSSAVANARLHFSAERGEVVIEDREDKERLVSLIGLGHKVRRLPSIGLVNAISCPAGLPAPEPACEAAADPRGEGVAVKVNLVKEIR